MKDGWISGELISFCEKITDGSHFSPESTNTGEYPYITVRDIEGDNIDFANCKFINKKNYDLLVRNGCKPNKGDILFSKDGTVGKVALVNMENDFVVLSSLAIISPNEKLVYPKYLKYYLTSPYFLSQAIGWKTGVAIKRIILKNLKKIEISFPPHDEQHRIVEKLDAAFAAIDQAIANTRQNLSNAQELSMSIYNSVFSQNMTWDYLKLDDVCIVERGSSPRPIKEYVTHKSDGVNWIKIGDTKNVDKYIFTTKEKITPKGAEKSRFVDIGDLILSNSMSFGKPYIMKTKGYIHDGWFVLKLKEFVDTEYLWHALSSPIVVEQINSLANGAIVKNISGDLVKKVVLPIPPKTEQIKITNQLDESVDLTSQLKSLYQQKLDDLNELKQSILQKAFQGELT